MAKQRGQIQARKHRGFWSFLWSYLGQKVRGPRKCWDRQRARNAKGLGTPKGWERQRAEYRQRARTNLRDPKILRKYLKDLKISWIFDVPKRGPFCRQQSKISKRVARSWNGWEQQANWGGEGKIRSQQKESLWRPCYNSLFWSKYIVRRWWEILVSKVDPFNIFQRVLITATHSVQFS